LLQDVAKDLLTLLSIDKNDKGHPSSKPLQAIRTKHAMLNKGSPISNTLNDLANNPESACKVLLGLQAALEKLLSWTSVDNKTLNKSKEEIRAMKPRGLSAFKKHQYEEMMQTKKRLNDSALLFCKEDGLDSLHN
jgi:hypothetical protein